MPVTEEAVLNALRNVIDPDLRRDIVTLGFVKDLAIDGGSVAFKVQLTTPACPVKDILREECIAEVTALPGVEKRGRRDDRAGAHARHRAAGPDPRREELHRHRQRQGRGGQEHGDLNLAVALSQAGARVGILDADVYGPSIPLMMGAQNERPYTESSKIIPIERFGVCMMSLGLLLEEGQAVLWRGPMVAGTVKQLLEDVDWGELDYLLVDLPPGTGDAPMSLAQLAPLAGVVIVTTPHHVAANIAGKSVQLFRRLNAPILGVVENMAGFVCPSCGEVARIFSGLTGEQLAEQIEVPYLGSVPLDPSVSEAGDKGIPAILSAPERPQGAAFKEIAGRLAQQVSIAAAAKSSK